MSDRVIALTEFKSLGYTQQQAADLCGVARHLAAASGLTLDDAERLLFRALADRAPKPTYYPAISRSGKWLSVDSGT